MPNSRNKSSDTNASSNSDQSALDGTEFEDTPDSKTRRKLEATRLQKLGRVLTELKPDQLKKLDLPIKLAEAIENYQRFPSRGAKRRQLQFIGRLMREIDTAAVEQELAVLQGQAAEAKYELRQLELWRDKLLQEADALTAFLAEHATDDRQRLRQLVSKSRKATVNGSDLSSPQAKAEARALFRFLRDSTRANEP